MTGWPKTYTSKHGNAYLVHRAKVSEKQPGSDIRKQFCEEVRVSNGMGFTASDVFVAQPLVSKRRIQDGQRLSGKAVLSLNKMRGNWGWRAISIAND